MKKHFTLYAQGEVPIPGIAAVPSRCGEKRPFTAHFKVWIECARLDSEGFVCNVRDIPAFFRARYGSKPTTFSCEQIADDACEHFMGVVNGALAVTAIVSPSPTFARYAKAEWRSE